MAAKRINEYGLPRSEFGGITDVYVGGGTVKCTQDDWDRIFGKKDNNAKTTSKQEET